MNIIKLSKDRDRVSLESLSDEFKELFCIPKTFRSGDSEFSEFSDSLDSYIKDVEEQDKILSEFFVFEMRRLLIFRHLMCMKSNFERNFIVFKNRRLDPEGLDIEGSLSRIDFPLSVNEKSFCYDPDDTACRVPKTLIKLWFNNSQELFYEETKKLLISSGYTNPMLSNLKDDMMNILKWRGYRYDGFVVGWMNSVIEKCRMYL
jgi:hypothetical protein